jgi:hypothetical protein
MTDFRGFFWGGKKTTTISKVDFPRLIAHELLLNPERKISTGSTELLCASLLLFSQ